ncbi:MAG: hypothetical protein ABSH16_00200 [Sedimentisphaerales bacterium]
MADYEFSTGPEGGANTAIKVVAASVMTLPVVSLTGGSLFLWAKGTATLKIGNTPVSLTLYGSIYSWNLYYATGITASGAIAITVEANTEISDLRVFAEAISLDALLYYYEDVKNNSGAIVIP